MISRNNISVLIPAAGLGKRSQLNYPKSLFKVKNIPIIVRIIKKIIKYDNQPSIVINKKYEKLFKDTLKNHSINEFEFLFQNLPTGMGDAVLKFKKSKFIKDTNHILLIWGDIPFIKKSSIDKLIKFHISNSNFMSILSNFSHKPYTLIKKDKNNLVKEIIETKDSKLKYKYGERDIGIFIFKKSLLKYLKNDDVKKEHNFLYVVKKIYNKKNLVKSLSIASKKETLSLNYISDLK